MTDAVIVHQLPGRIRLKVPAMRGVASFFSGIAAQLQETRDVVAVQGNPVTASLLVHYKGEPAALLERFNELDLHPQIKTQTSDGARRIALPKVRLVSGREINPMFMAGCALATIGLAQTVRGKILVPSVTALWYAIEAFRAAGRR
jgi:hypothetical protein